MERPDVRVRTASSAEVAWMVERAADEGWNPGWRDPECFSVVDPDGFLVAVAGDRPVGCVACVRYGDAFAFFGFYIVVPELRGQGVGGPLFAAMLDRAGDRTVGLDGVLAQADRYRAAGFVLEHHTLRFATGARDGGRRPGRADDVAPTRVVALAEVPFDALTAYDARCFPAPRRAFLRRWTTAAGHVGRAAVRGRDVAGFAVARPCREGAKVGPLFADDPESAGVLLDALARAVDARPLFLDVPDHHPEAVALVEARGLQPVSETVRMYRGPAPDFDRARVFATTTLELG